MRGWWMLALLLGCSDGSGDGAALATPPMDESPDNGLPATAGTCAPPTECPEGTVKQETLGYDLLCEDSAGKVVVGAARDAYTGDLMSYWTQAPKTVARCWPDGGIERISRCDTATSCVTACYDDNGARTPCDSAEMGRAYTLAARAAGWRDYQECYPEVEECGPDAGAEE